MQKPITEFTTGLDDNAAEEVEVITSRRSSGSSSNISNSSSVAPTRQQQQQQQQQDDIPYVDSGSGATTPREIISKENSSRNNSSVSNFGGVNARFVASGSVAGNMSESRSRSRSFGGSDQGGRDSHSSGKIMMGGSINSSRSYHTPSLHFGSSSSREHHDHEDDDIDSDGIEGSFGRQGQSFQEGEMVMGTSYDSNASYVTVEGEQNATTNIRFSQDVSYSSSSVDRTDTSSANSKSKSKSFNESLVADEDSASSSSSSNKKRRSNSELEQQNENIHQQQQSPRENIPISSSSVGKEQQPHQTSSSSSLKDVSSSRNSSVSKNNNKNNSGNNDNNKINGKKFYSEAEIEEWREEQIQEKTSFALFQCVLRVFFYPLMYPFDSYVNIVRKIMITCGAFAMIGFSVVFVHVIMYGQSRNKDSTFRADLCGASFGLVLLVWAEVTYILVRTRQISADVGLSLLTSVAVVALFFINAFIKYFHGEVAIIAVLAAMIVARIRYQSIIVPITFVIALLATVRSSSFGVVGTPFDDTDHESNKILSLFFVILTVTTLWLSVYTINEQYAEFVRHLESNSSMIGTVTNVAEGITEWNFEKSNAALTKYSKRIDSHLEVLELLSLVETIACFSWEILPRDIIRRLELNGNKTLLDDIVVYDKRAAMKRGDMLLQRQALYDEIIMEMIEMEVNNNNDDNNGDDETDDSDADKEEEQQTQITHNRSSNSSSPSTPTLESHDRQRKSSMSSDRSSGSSGSIRSSRSSSGSSTSSSGSSGSRFSERAGERRKTKKTSSSSSSSSSGEKAVTILVIQVTNTDIHSELIEQDELSFYISEYFNIVVSIIESHGGMVITMTPQKIVAAWTSELFISELTNKHASNRNSNHEENRASLACFAAMHINKQLRDKVVPLFRAEACAFPYRIAIHRGAAQIGSVGDREFSRYTIIGPAVDFVNNFVKLAWNITTRGIVVSDDVLEYSAACKAHPGFSLIARAMVSVSNEPLFHPFSPVPFMFPPNNNNNHNNPATPATLLFPSPSSFISPYIDNNSSSSSSLVNISNSQSNLWSGFGVFVSRSSSSGQVNNNTNSRSNSNVKPNSSLEEINQPKNESRSNISTSSSGSVPPSPLLGAKQTSSNNNDANYNNINAGSVMKVEAPETLSSSNYFPNQQQQQLNSPSSTKNAAAAAASATTNTNKSTSLTGSVTSSTSGTYNSGRSMSTSSAPTATTTLTSSSFSQDTSNNNIPSCCVRETMRIHQLIGLQIEDLDNTSTATTHFPSEPPVNFDPTQLSSFIEIQSARILFSQNHSVGSKTIEILKSFNKALDERERNGNFIAAADIYDRILSADSGTLMSRSRWPVLLLQNGVNRELVELLSRKCKIAHDNVTNKGEVEDPMVCFYEL